MGVLKVGIVGCGFFGNYHLDNIMKLDDVKVVAFASSNKERLEKTGAKVSGARLYIDYRSMFDAEKDLDAVFVVVPPDSHGDVEILAAQKGIHIYTEKPMALSLEKAFEVRAAIGKSKVISAVGFQERYRDITDKIKQHLAVARTGLVYGCWLGNLPDVDWWRRKERSGGQVVEQSIHVFDLLRNFFGEARTVFCTAFTGIIQDLDGYNIEDGSSTTVVFRNNVIATVHTGCFFNETAPHLVKIQIACRNSVVDYKFGREVSFIQNDHVEKFISSENSHMKSVKAFFQAIRSDDPGLVRSNYADAVETLRITFAANESMHSGQPVALA